MKRLKRLLLGSVGVALLLAGTAGSGQRTRPAGVDQPGAVLGLTLTNTQVFAGKPYTAVVKITLDQVKDPAPKPPIVPGTVTLPAGDRMIELKVTVANVGSQAVYGGARYEPMPTYVVGPAMRTQYGLPLYVPFVHGLPEGNGSTAAPGDC